MLVHHPTRAPRGGFSLVDVCVALTILAIALGTLVGSVFHAMRLEEANAEQAAASEYLRATIERLDGMPFDELFAAYNATDVDDPEPGRDYFGELAATDPLLVVGKKDGPVLSMTFPGDGTTLREDAVDAVLGMPRDLNADGNVDGADHSGDYVVLPMTLRIEWEGGAGTRSLEMSTLLRDR